jgi:hypothetical protein
MTGNMPVVPTRASLSASGRAASPSTIHNASQHFFGTQSTSHTESFQQQTAHLQQSMQQSHFSPVAAGARATGPGSAESRTTTAFGRDTNSATARSGNQAAASDNGTRGSTAPATSSANRGEQATSTHGEPNRSEWKTFTPPSPSNESAGRGESGAESASRGESGSYWNRTSPGSSSSRESGSSRYGRGSYSRPQLNMRQPIAQPRSSAGYGGYRGAPSSTGGASHSAPSSGGASHSSGGGHSGGGGHH